MFTFTRSTLGRCTAITLTALTCTAATAAAEDAPIAGSTGPSAIAGTTGAAGSTGAAPVQTTVGEVADLGDGTPGVVKSVTPGAGDLTNVVIESTGLAPNAPRLAANCKQRGVTAGSKNALGLWVFRLIVTKKWCWNSSGKITSQGKYVQTKQLPLWTPSGVKSGTKMASGKSSGTTSASATMTLASGPTGTVQTCTPRASITFKAGGGSSVFASGGC